MTKKQYYYGDVFQLLKNNEFTLLEQYLLNHSNLPGRMANLTLISTVADIMDEHISISESWYLDISKWFDVQADGNDSNTILILTALESFGAMFPHVSEETQSVINKQLKKSLNDVRWRVREIVTESYKRIGLFSYGELIKQFCTIIENKPTPLEIRGILATVAHPDILRTNEQLAFSQKIMVLSFDSYLTFDSEKFTKEDKLILKKGLSFAPSVIINKNPKDGFLFFETLISQENKELTQIIKENLKKKRLSSFYPDEVKHLLQLIESHKK